LAVERQANGNAQIVDTTFLDPVSEDDFYFMASTAANTQNFGVTHPNFGVLGSVSCEEGEVKFVNQKPDWFIVDTGMEEFLVKRRYDAGYDATVLFFERITTDTVHQMSQRLFAAGVEGLLRVDSQQLSELSFANYAPTPVAVFPALNLDFEG